MRLYEGFRPCPLIPDQSGELKAAQRGRIRFSPSLKRRSSVNASHIDALLGRAHSIGFFVGMDPPNGSFITPSIQPVFPLAAVGGGGAADREAARTSDSESEPTSRLHHQGPRVRARRPRVCRLQHSYSSICILSSAVMKPFIRLSLRNKEWNLGNLTVIVVSV